MTLTDPTRTRSIRRRYTLPDLSFDPAALEPHCDAEAIVIHHDYHHASLVAGANHALDCLEIARESHEWSSISQLEADLAFHVSGHILHSIFWTNLAPAYESTPRSALADAIDQNFGDFAGFREQFTQAATALQGSGWVALTWEPLGSRLVLQQIHDNHTTVTLGSQPLLVCDVWEHAYYLQYRHARAAWIESFWRVVNWIDVSARFSQMQSMAHGSTSRHGAS